jgi:hypothetical protein
MKNKLITYSVLALLAVFVMKIAQSSERGPMVGHATHTSATVWGYR